MMVKGMIGNELGGAVSHSFGSGGVNVINLNSPWDISFTFSCNLAPGMYFMNAGVVGVVDGEEVYLHRIIDALVFKVNPEKEIKMTGIMDFQIVSELSN